MYNPSTYKYFTKRPNPPLSTIEPHRININIYLDHVTMDNFYHYHHENRFERTLIQCKEYKNIVFNIFMD